MPPACLCVPSQQVAAIILEQFKMMATRQPKGCGLSPLSASVKGPSGETVPAAQVHVNVTCNGSRTMQGLQIVQNTHQIVIQEDLVVHFDLRSIANQD